MKVPFKEKKNYIQDELKKLEGFEMGWVMKEYDDEEHGNSVTLFGLDKGQAFDIDASGTRATVAQQSCYVVEYMFNETSNAVVFTDDDLEGAIDFTLKLIALAKA